MKRTPLSAIAMLTLLLPAVTPGSASGQDAAQDNDADLATALLPQGKTGGQQNESGKQQRSRQ